MPVQELDPIQPQEAAKILEKALIENLGEDWQKEASGWLLVYRTDYMARLTKGQINREIHIGPTGLVTIEDRDITWVQTSGRLVAWMLLGVSLFLAFALAKIAGFLG